MIKSPILRWDKTNVLSSAYTSNELWICSSTLWNWFPESKHSRSVQFNLYSTNSEGRLKLSVLPKSASGLDCIELDGVAVEADVSIIDWLEKKMKSSVMYVECNYE